ncbi:hypothetical protein [Pedobacter panaciterrae]|uniref:hypothetical protein n=1 Tax=Pedobacter panaciterrae TaxID=363849 RepID=UPI002598863B|nr:hypothetical protein [uncultured Pedobacter sp.]
MEAHPRVKIGQELIKYDKIILGSFPTWHLTEPDPEKNETHFEKETLRLINQDIDYFYGSSSNRFWDWYKRFIDEGSDRQNKISLTSSLQKRRIGITDVIASCRRKGKSALDQHLTSRIYNHDFFQYPTHGAKLKILCTSKGVMNEMLLNNSFFSKHPAVRLDVENSQIMQDHYSKIIGGDVAIRKRFCNCLEIKNGGFIECFAIPSPGSPFRKLREFGCCEENLSVFLDKYLKMAFDWFIED